MEDTPEVRNGSKRRKSEVVMVSDLVVGESGRPPMARSNSTFSAADLETALAKAGCGKFNLALLVLTFPASCTSSFDTSSMSFAMPAASVDLDLTLSQGALLQSSCYAGMIIGGFIWGPLSDAFGRKKLLVIGYLVDALMNFLAGAFPIFPLMMLFKFLAGLMICGLSPIFTAYIAEIYPKKGRDTVILSTGFSSATGQVLQASLAMWIIPIEVPSEIPFKSWQLFQMASALPSLISGIGCLFFVESPKFLADKGNHEGALKVCQTIYTINTGNRSSAYPVKRLNNTSRTTDYENKSKLSKLLEGLDILKPPFVQRAVVLFSINILAVGSFSTLRLWLPEMLTFVSKSTLDPNLGLCPLLEEGNSMRGNLSSTNLHSRDVFSTMMLVNSGCLIGHIVLLCTFSCIGIKAMQKRLALVF
ncbi:unnamed protein product [Nezara viridula]|uniref:Major facilitator superfamily (MFS) profile domain-containing protein n=1 Tax=Nezara viridula TaxID=85310 RepID=A0A9P0HST4_NEZVI|nr:unnamed protein product [Nezara viridula]